MAVKFEDAKGVIRNLESKKDRHTCNSGQKKNKDTKYYTES